MSLRVLVGCLLLACAVASVGAVDLSWTDTGQVQTENVDLTEGLVYLSVSSTGPSPVMVYLKDAEGNAVDTALSLEGGYQEASWAYRIETDGAYYLEIKGYSGTQEWTVSMTDPPEDDDPDAGPEWTGKGMESTGLFTLGAGTAQLVLSSPGGASAELLDDQGRRVGGIVLSPGDATTSKELAIESDGQYIINVDGRGNSEEWTVSVDPITGPPPLPSPTVEPAPVATPTLETPAATPVPTAPIVVPASRFGSRRYLVGNAPASPPVGISVRGPGAVPTRVSRQLGAGSTSYSPPKGGFIRWYPATRWRTGR